MSFTRVVIGIQARSTSQRLPGKVTEMLGDRSVLDHVLHACNQSAEYVNRNGRNGAIVKTALCVPSGDPISEMQWPCSQVVMGPEHDVLTRYMRIFQWCEADYIVRITADCPLIPSFVITKHITCALMNDYDYVSNVDENCRTAADGMDCEVISRRLIKYADENAKSLRDREHVTTFIRSNPPSWIRRGMIINFLDLSNLKLSVDTQEDLDRVRAEHLKIEKALKYAEGVYGKQNVHRL